MAKLPKNPLHKIRKIECYVGDDTVHRLIGKHIDLEDKIFTKEKAELCQQMINEASGSCFEQNAEAPARLTKLCDAMVSGQGDIPVLYKKMASEAFALKSQSDSLSFDLIADVALSLSNYCNHRKVFEDAHENVVRKHIDTLNVAFSQKLEGDGGETGKQLLAALYEMVKRFD